MTLKVRAPSLSVRSTLVRGRHWFRLWDAPDVAPIVNITSSYNSLLPFKV